MGRLSLLHSDSMPISDYRKAKIKILKRDFQIDVTLEEENHLNTLESEFAVDRYARTIISNHWKN